MASLLLQGPGMAVGVCVNDLVVLDWLGCVESFVLLVCSRSEMKILYPTFCSCFSGFSIVFVFGFFFLMQMDLSHQWFGR